MVEFFNTIIFQHVCLVIKTQNSLSWKRTMRIIKSSFWLHAADPTSVSVVQMLLELQQIWHCAALQSLCTNKWG